LVSTSSALAPGPGHADGDRRTVDGGEELGVDAGDRERAEQDHQHHQQIGGVGVAHKGADQTTPRKQSLARHVGCRSFAGVRGLG
jgi:hypothetical protein